MVGSITERWRAIRALLDLGDADGAERLAREIGLSEESAAGGKLEEAVAAREVLARISCLRERYGEAARLLEPAPPSAL